MTRLFFALDIEEQDKKALAHWRETSLKLPFKKVPKDNFHVTLAFLGNISTEQQTALISFADQIAKAMDVQMDILLTEPRFSSFQVT